MNEKEFIEAVELVTKEKGISKDVVFDAMELALASAYRKNFDSKTNVRVDLNRETGEIKVFRVFNVVKEIPENTEDELYDSYILLKDAKEKVKDIKVGETFEEEVTPKDFGRVATATAKQVVIQK